MKNSAPGLHFRLVRLNAKLDRTVVEFGPGIYWPNQKQDVADAKESYYGALKTTAKTVAGGAALLGGAAYLRGRSLRKPGGPASLVEPGFAGVKNTIKAGVGALGGDLKKGFGAAKSAFSKFGK